MEHKITVKRRSADYHVCIDGDERLWACGKSIDEAIGNLVRTHNKRLDIQMEYSDISSLAEALPNKPRLTEPL